CAGLALGALASSPGMEWLAVTLALLLSLLVALESGAIRVAALRRRGWREVAVIAAASREEAEIRYFNAAREGFTKPAAAVSAARPSGQVRLGQQGQETMLGMLDYPGAR